MSQKGFISDADAALADLIWKAIENESAAKDIISSKELISFSPPKAKSYSARNPKTVGFSIQHSISNIAKG